MGNSLTWTLFVQGVGFVAAALGIFCFQGKTRARIIIVQSIACVLWVTQFILLGNALSGAVLNTIFAVRGFVFAYRDKLGKLNCVALPIVFSAFLVIAEFFIFSGPLDILPLVGGIASTVAVYQTKEQKIRIFSLLSSPCWLIYDVFAGSVAGTITESLAICSILIALYRSRKEALKYGIVKKK